MVKFKGFSRPLNVFQVLFKVNCIFKDFSRQSCIFKYFSSLCEPCSNGKVFKTLKNIAYLCRASRITESILLSVEGLPFCAWPKEPKTIKSSVAIKFGLRKLNLKNRLCWSSVS